MIKRRILIQTLTLIQMMMTMITKMIAIPVAITKMIVTDPMITMVTTTATMKNFINHLQTSSLSVAIPLMWTV